MSIEEITEFTHRFVEDSFPPRRTYDEIPKEDANRMQGIMVEVLSVIIERAKGRHDWGEVCGHEIARPPGEARVLIPMVSAQMSKIGGTAQLHLYGSSVHFTFRLPFLEEIPSMDDSFWAALASVSSDHGLSYDTSACNLGLPGIPGNRELEKFKKSGVFRLLRDFIVCYQKDPYFLDLGDFGISFSIYEDDWLQIRDKLIPVVADFGKLSHQLYRSHYLKSRSRKKS
jgi:hypothetical protein